MSDEEDDVIEYYDVFVPEEDDDEFDDRMTAEKEYEVYKNLFQQTAFNHDDFCFASFHMLIGSLPNIRSILVQKGATILDPRLHVFYIASSGSGKGAAMNFIAKCGTEAGLTLQSCGAITSNALTGTREKVDKPKPKSGEGPPTEFDKWTMTDGYLNPDVMPSNICFFTESAELITTKPASDMRKCLDHFQKAMNPYKTEDNRISKKTGLGPEITFFPNTSLLYTTYKPVELAEVITQRGFLQRCFFLIRDVTLDDRFADLEEVIDGMDTPMPDLTSIVNLLKRIDAYYGEKKVKTLTIDRSILPSVKAHMRHYRRILMNCNDYIQEKLVDFIPRFHDIYWKIAMHSCILRLDTVIRDEDIAYAHFATKDKFENTLQYLATNIPVPPEVKRREIDLFTKVKRVFDALKERHEREWFELPSLAKVLIRNKIFVGNRQAYYYLFRLHSTGHAELSKDNTKVRLIKNRSEFA